MEEPDIILFVMDGKEGLTLSDKEVISILRRLNKPVFYIMNKINGLSFLMNVFNESDSRAFRF